LDSRNSVAYIGAGSTVYSIIDYITSAVELLHEESIPNHYKTVNLQVTTIQDKSYNKR